MTAYRYVNGDEGTLDTSDRFAIWSRFDLVAILLSADKLSDVDADDRLAEFGGDIADSIRGFIGQFNWQRHRNPRPPFDPRNLNHEIIESGES